MNTQVLPLAVVTGVRTPFAKAFGKLNSYSAVQLGSLSIQGLMNKTRFPCSKVDEVIFGNVASPADASNVARVIALQSGIPDTSIAQTVNRNCGSGMESIIAAWHAIREQRSEVIVAGGTESMSNIPLLFHRNMTEWLLTMRSQRSWFGSLRTLLRFRPRFLKPIIALELGLTDPVSGLNMGQTAETLAMDFSISREEQDAFALSSHQKAHAAQQRCFLSGEILSSEDAASGLSGFEKDDGIRPDTNLTALTRLKPRFQKQDGTVTVGNSGQITDGAASLLLAHPDRAADMDLEPLGYILDYAVAGCDPRRMGLGPVYAITKLLKKTGLTLNDIDLFEINEAFAAQVLACLKALNSKTFSQEQLGLTQAPGQIDPDKVNVHGGSIALGHPVGVTGTRLVLTLLRALRERRMQRGIATLCVGGGQGIAMLIETDLRSTEH